MLENWEVRQYTNPWPYVIIDNFYDEETWAYIQENIVKNPNKYFKQWPERWGVTKGPTGRATASYGPLGRAVDRGNRWSYEPHEDPVITNYFLKHTGEDFIKQYFKTYRAYTKPLVSEVSCKYNKEQYRHMGVHDEKTEKVLSVISYLSPLYNTGTIIYDENKVFNHIITWKQNRAMAMCGLDGVTWHDVMQTEPTDSPSRITIDYFLLRDESDYDLPNFTSK
jgi:hypothetical protein